MLDHACTSLLEPFSFVYQSRPATFTIDDLAFHMNELFSCMPAQSWLLIYACPLLASAIVLATYPPDSHNFPILQVYTAVYQSVCRQTLNHNIVQLDERSSFESALQRQMCSLVETMSSQNYSAALLHTQQLADLRVYSSQITSNRTCLSCIFRTPEKPLKCGHALCETCIRIHGTRDRDDKHTFNLRACPLCLQNLDNALFSFVPATAGIRVLALDGGGVRGIISLVILLRIEESLKDIGIPITNLFDLVCGTSAGGLITLGIFMMQWSVAECIQKFETLAENTFKRPQGLWWLGNLQSLAFSYLRDGRYSASPIEQSFMDQFGEGVKMFNLLGKNNRIAVTTTTTKDPRPCLLSNYNGGIRPEGLGYDVLRAERPELDMTLDQAASCTSAAPWYFRPKTVNSVGYQDGGLQHNNPLRIALWEVAFMWPGHPIPDFALTIGTGVSAPILGRLGSTSAQSPTKDRFIKRLAKAFMKSLDGERMWKEFFNGLPDSVKHRYHRLNMNLAGAEPAIDDLTGMHELKEQALTCNEIPRQLKPLLDSIYASLFYLELDGFPAFGGFSYHCEGHIRCRVQMTDQQKRAFNQKLMRSCSYFLINGQPVSCIDRITKSMPPFQRKVRFNVDSLDDIVAVTLRGVTSMPTTISGLPKTVKEILQLQQISAAFGRTDHTQNEKILPCVPSKRKRQACRDQSSKVRI